MDLRTKLTLINAGSGLQSAVSFIYELSILKEKNFSTLHVIVSSEVADGLYRLKRDTMTLNLLNNRDFRA